MVFVWITLLIASLVATVVLLFAQVESIPVPSPTVPTPVPLGNPITSSFIWAPMLRHSSNGVWSLWYNQNGTTAAGRVDLVLRTSWDAQHWLPPQVVNSGDNWGTAIFPWGGGWRWLPYRISPAPSGVYVANSTDGAHWDPLRATDLVTTGDIIDAFYDPIRVRFGIFGRLYPNVGEWPPVRTQSGPRLTGISYSTNLDHWSPPARVFVPDITDPPQLEFYGAACCVVRGNRLIAFLRVLRDNQAASPEIGVQGIGYTVLAWTDDGTCWKRSQTPFLDRRLGEFDGAMAWAYSVEEVNGTIYLAYSAYDQGHKVGNRSIGISTIPSDALVVPESGVAGQTCT